MPWIIFAVISTSVAVFGAKYHVRCMKGQPPTPIRVKVTEMLVEKR